MNFLAWMIFVPLWITFSYTIGAFSLWAGGFLFKLGVIDYSGGYVIHLSSGTAGFCGALVIGPRLEADREDKRPNNTLLVLVGAGILWIGWNGFNGGDPVRPSLLPPVLLSSWHSPTVVRSERRCWCRRTEH
jgi:Amt family ammonium transporter